MAEGMKITLSPLSNGLTVDERGRKLLKQPFVFQCGPMEEFAFARSFSMGNYDTIASGEFTRKGSRKLRTWEFDTLVMEIGSNEDGTRIAPGWVPYPQYAAARRPVAPEWYTKQLADLHDSGAPFHFGAQFPNSGGHFAQPSEAVTVLYCGAVLLGYKESRKAGEGDAIYLEGVEFSEWRDPTISQRSLTAPHKTNFGLPATVTLMPNGEVLTARHTIIPKQPKHGHTKQATLADLAKYFYHSPDFWRIIARENKLAGGGQNQPLVRFKRYHNRIPKHGVKMKIPSPFEGPLYGDDSLRAALRNWFEEGSWQLPPTASAPKGSHFSGQFHGGPVRRTS